MNGNSNKDVIFLENLQLSAVVGSDAWRRLNKAQPVVISVRYHSDTQGVGSSDNIQDTLSYGRMCKEITAAVEGRDWNSPSTLLIGISKIAEEWPNQEDVEVSIFLPKAILRLDGGLRVSATFKSSKAPDGHHSDDVYTTPFFEWSVERLRLACIIGVNTHERKEKQEVIIHIRSFIQLFRSIMNWESSMEPDFWRQVVTKTTEEVEPSSFETLEALATCVADLLLEEFALSPVTIKIEKPSALTFVEGAGVEITRSLGPDDS